MNNQPNITYHAACAATLPGLDSLEMLVPGAMVYAVPVQGRKIRLKNVRPDQVGSIQSCQINVPIHGAWLVESQISQWGVQYSYSAEGIGGLSGWDNSPEARGRVEAAGRQSAARSVATGELRPHVLEMATNYQFMGAAWARVRPWAFFVYACGAGKTLTAIMAFLGRPGPVLVTCPAKARHVWWSQIQEYTTLKPFRVKPSSEMRKKDQTFAAYMDECRVENQRPVIIMGAESMADNMAIVNSLQPESVIFDELHMQGSRKRWTALQQADGSVRFERKKTAASGREGSKISRENRAVAMMDLSRMKSIKLRLGLSATPLDDGRPRRLWSQLDLLAPGGFSHSYSNFAHRYCDAKPGQFGGLDDGGSSNMLELKARCSFIIHEVSYSESHSELPDTRVQVTYLSSRDLNRAERWSDDKTFGQAVKAISRESKKDASAKERVVEARLAEACTRKRKYVVSEAIEGLKGGGKVVIFTARRRETELWAHDLRRMLKRGDETLGEVPVWMAHGGVSEGERDKMVDTFRVSTGPCCLIATGQSVGTGVDGMQTANLAIFAMLPWKPGDFSQWKGRFDRLGGNATLLKVPVAEGTYDERVVEILTDKFGPIREFLAADELAHVDDKLLGLEDTGVVVDSIVSKLCGGE